MSDLPDLRDIVKIIGLFAKGRHPEELAEELRAWVPDVGSFKP
jgi:hypothetical protein